MRGTRDRPRTPAPVPPPALRAPNGLRIAPFPLPDTELVLLHWNAPADPRFPASLSEAEVAVVELALRGLSNEEIAAIRGRSIRTIGNQLASVYRKLGVGSRAELAAQLAGDGARRT